MLKAVCIVLGVAVNALPADIELAPNGRGTNFATIDRNVLQLKNTTAGRGEVHNPMILGGVHNPMIFECWENPLACIKDELNGYGVLVHGMGGGSVVLNAYTKGDLDWDSMTDKWIMDCASGNSLAETVAEGITYCSAWSFLQKGLVPMIYNYPSNEDGRHQHSLGLVVRSGTQFDQNRVTRMFAVDGYTEGRGGYQGQGGVSTSDVDAWKTACPVWPKAYENTQLWCVFRSPDQDWQSCNYNDQVFEIPVGPNGENWADIFMYENYGQPETLMSARNTNERQCQFKPEDFDQWRTALNSMYDKAKYQLVDDPAPGASYPQEWAVNLPNDPNTPDENLYLENELVMETKGSDLMAGLKQDQSLLGVWVQTDPKCTIALGWNDLQHQTNGKIKTTEQVCDAAYAGESSAPCGDGDIEDCQIQQSIQAACKVADQLTREGLMGGNKVPVLMATFPTNSVPDVQQWERWRADEYGQDIFYKQVPCAGS